MNKVAEAINAAESILILPHTNPDADAMGSVYAVSYGLSGIGKKCRVIVEDEIPKFIHEYTDGEYEIFDSEKEYSADLCLCIDCGDLGRIANRAKIFDSVKMTASIDHHYTNTLFADVNYVESDTPAAAVIIYKLFQYMNIPVDDYIARNLYAAICGDTGNFKYSNVNSETFNIAGELIKHNIRHWDISRAIFDTEDLKSMSIKGELIKNIEVFADGYISVISAPKEIFERHGVNERDISDIVELARRVRGCEVAVSLKETDKGVKVSLRSADVSDVSKIAAIYGGGGHIKAAGFVVEGMSMDELKAKLVSDISDHLKDIKLL